jgi:tetratricopeptide (TPR) repeat protein
VAYGDLNDSNKRLIRYGAIGALCILIVGGAFVFFDRAEKPVSTSSAAATASSPSTPSPAKGKTSAAASTAAPAAAAQTSSSGDPVVPTDAQSDQVRGFIADAHRLADAGNFTDAQAALDKADKVIPGLPETDQARSDIAAMATPQGQLNTQFTRARLAIDQNDDAAAEKALAEAERLSPQAPQIAELRLALQKAQQKEASHKSRITALLASMREAIARHDLAAADSALNEAARIDIQDPSVQQARIELNRAQNQKTETENKELGAIPVSPTQALGGAKH